MDEKSGRTKKTRASNMLRDLIPPSDPGSRSGMRPRRRASRTGVDDPNCETEPMRVIEGGARKRSPDINDHIGRQLKAVYDDMLRQPVPSRFTDLLRELASKSENDDG